MNVVWVVFKVYTSVRLNLKISYKYRKIALFLDREGANCFKVSDFLKQYRKAKLIVSRTT